MESATTSSVELRETPTGSSLLALAGPLDVETAARTREELKRTLSRAHITSLEVDASGISRGDMSGMVILYELLQGRFTQGTRGHLKGLRPELGQILSTFCSESAESAPVRQGLVKRVGASAIAAVHRAHGQIVFLGSVLDALWSAARRPRLLRGTEIARIYEKAGVDALPVVSLISLLTGLIIAFESTEPLAAFGAQIYIANAIGRTMVRELGPIMTAMLLAGRSGSAFAAELGSMKLNEELDALETMGLDPLRFLVIQRIIAGSLLSPLLTVYAMALGVVGGVIVMLALGFSLTAIVNQLASALTVSDVLVGLAKGLVFGATVAAIGCERGIATGQGPSAVGDSTTHAVVAGVLAIVVFDSAFAFLAYLLHI
ncbi:MAG TPA: ABC transporter permease [Anaeromyxobacteraceae bacterium]|nr:ABC transporter permease [Anaeromyxobacteraceae bacterium]